MQLKASDRLKIAWGDKSNEVTLLEDINKDHTLLKVRYDNEKISKVQGSRVVEINGEKVQWCGSCKQYLPPTIELFHRRTGNRNGLSGTCKECLLAQNDKRKEKIEEDIEVKQVEPPKFKLYKQYEISRTRRERTRKFKGKCIYHDKRLLTLRNDRGITETFLKMDFVTKEYSFKEC